MHSMNKIKFIIARQAKEIYKNKGINVALHKTKFIQYIKQKKTLPSEWI